MSEYLVNTPCGALRGTTCQWPGVAAYRGIRYATAGRWEYPRPVTHWDGVYDATAYGDCCYQMRAFQDEAKSSFPFYYNEFRKDEQYTYSEDCLFLNVWTPEGAKPGDGLPVLFYIHGGAFTGGCGHEKHFDGPVWPTKGVIAVTINYRLGPLGFACLPQLAEEAGHTGNYGLYDQLAALQWVRDNIAAFGGNAEKITIMGQSAGAMSVQQLCLSPLAKGMFAGAVLSSGGGIGLFSQTEKAEGTYAFWQDVMRRADCDDLAAFRALDVEEVLRAWQAATAARKERGLNAVPVIDGAFITKSAADTAAAGEQTHVPYLIGSTSHDMVPPVLHKMAKDWSRLQARQGGPASYTWLFDRMLPGDSAGAWHSSDLWYWFGTLDHCWRPFTEKDRRLSDEMSSYLTNFAKTGNPNGDGLPEWLPTEKGQNLVLRIGEGKTRMGGVNLARLTKIMMTSNARGEH